MKRRDKMSVRSRMMAVIEDVAKEQERNLAAIEDDLPLAQSGLDSLCFAIIVARLEDEFGIDPFSASDEIAFPVTFADLVALYEDAKID